MHAGGTQSLPTGHVSLVRGLLYKQTMMQDVTRDAVTLTVPAAAAVARVDCSHHGQDVQGVLLAPDQA